MVTESASIASELFLSPLLGVAGLVVIGGVAIIVFSAAAIIYQDVICRQEWLGMLDIRLG
jgi:hypothetical protein